MNSIMEIGANIILISKGKMAWQGSKDSVFTDSNESRPAYLPVDALLTDAIFSPVLRVNYGVEAARVGQRTDFERLAMDV